MPFRKSAKITVSNESDKPCHAFFYYVDWQKHASLPADTAYFHAMYRQEHPCVMGRNYLLADIVGRGHYVGTIQSVYHVSDGWYGEGDDFFFIDGEKEPSLRGTGTEDYFCDAWGFRQQDGPFYGTPLWDSAGDTAKAGNRSTAYRFHIADPVTFQKSLRAEIEHKGSQSFPDGTGSGFIERDDLMSSVAFWYQTEPHKPWPALPPGPERLSEQRRTLVAGWQAVATAKHSEHPIQVQALPGVALAGKQLFFTPADAKGWVELAFTLDKEFTGALTGELVHAPDYGKYRVTLDGQEVGVVDLYSTKIERKAYSWNAPKLAAGAHVLRFECQGKAEASKGYFLGIDSISAVTRPYVRPPGFDLRKIQR
jgi:hypothetical protein